MNFTNCEFHFFIKGIIFLLPPKTQAINHVIVRGIEEAIKCRIVSSWLLSKTVITNIKPVT